MEATATVSKASIDAKTREMNVKAKQAAIADLVKAANPKAKTNVIKEQKPKQEVKAPKPPKPSMAGKLDEILRKGGKWADLIAKAEAESKLMGGHIKYNVGTLKAHIRFRTITQKKADYLGTLQVTDNGIEKITPTSKSKK